MAEESPQMELILLMVIAYAVLRPAAFRKIIETIGDPK